MKTTLFSLCLILAASAPSLVVADTTPPAAGLNDVASAVKTLLLNRTLVSQCLPYLSHSTVKAITSDAGGAIVETKHIEIFSNGYDQPPTEAYDQTVHYIQDGSAVKSYIDGSAAYPMYASVEPTGALVELPDYANPRLLSRRCALDEKQKTHCVEKYNTGLSPIASCEFTQP